MAASSGDCLGAAGVDISPRRDDGRRSVSVGEQYQRVLDEHVERIAAQHGGLEVSGKACRRTVSFSRAIDSAKENGMLVMGTHSRKALGRACSALSRTACCSILSFPRLSFRACSLKMSAPSG
ncbi:MAG: hypothetical protein ACLTQI_04560 [Slackia sp.]